MVGAADLALIASALATLLVGALSFMGRGVVSDTKEHEKKLADQDKRLAVLEASQLHEKVTDHGIRLVAIESGLNEIKSDLRVIKVWVEAQARKDL